MTPSDVAPAGKGLVLVDVTNASTSVRADRAPEICRTPCVLTLAPGSHRLYFEYEFEGEQASDETFISVAEHPQVYRRQVYEAHVRSRAGRISAIALWALGQAAMLAALGLFAADDTDAIRAARRGLAYGGLGALALTFPIALLSVRRTRGVGVQFPWQGAAPASPTP